MITSSLNRLRRTAFFDAINLNAFRPVFQLAVAQRRAFATPGAIISALAEEEAVQRDFHLQRLTIAQQAQLHFRARFGSDTLNVPGKAIQRLTVDYNHVSGISTRPAEPARDWVKPRWQKRHAERSA